MYEAVNVVLQPDERAEAGKFGDITGNEIADLVILVNVRPRVLGQLFDTDGDALVGFVHFQNDGFQFVALLHNLRRVIDLARPGNVRDVNHAVEPFLQFDESAVTGEVANLAFDAGAGRVFLLGTVPRVGFELADAEADFLLVTINAEHDSFDILVWFEHVAGLGDTFGPGKFGDMHEPL